MHKNKSKNIIFYLYLDINQAFLEAKDRCDFECCKELTFYHCLQSVLFLAAVEMTIWAFSFLFLKSI